MAYAENTEVPLVRRKELSAARTARWRDRLRCKRRGELDAKRAARPNISTPDIAWAAGHFEGEGTCTVCRAGRYTTSLVTLTSTDPEVIDFFQTRWSATGVRIVPANDRHKAKHVWTLKGERMRNFLLDIQPFLQTTRRQQLAALAIEAYDARRQGARKPGYPEKMDAYRSRFAELNRRGPPQIIGKMPTQLLLADQSA